MVDTVGAGSPWARLIAWDGMVAAAMAVGPAATSPNATDTYYSTPTPRRTPTTPVRASPASSTSGIE